MEMFPPTKVCSDPPMDPKIDLERTVIPLTKPRFLAIFFPGNSNDVVMFDKSIMIKVYTNKGNFSNKKEWRLTTPCFGNLLDDR
jgi:hypothetical protein